MSLLGNLIWFLFGGLWMGLGWVLAGLLWCVTIVGIPIGMQCFKLAGLAFFPFGKEVVYGGGGGALFPQPPLVGGKGVSPALPAPRSRGGSRSRHGWYGHVLNP